MTTWKLWRIGLVAVVGLVAAGGPATAQDQAATLKDLPGVAVRVTLSGADVEKDGLTSGTIQTEVENQLRSADVRVLTDAERLATTAKALLDVRVSVNASLNFPGWLVCGADVRLLQTGVLGNGATASVATWDTSSVGQVASRRVASSVGGSVKSMLKGFLNDWLAMHPKT